MSASLPEIYTSSAAQLELQYFDFSTNKEIDWTGYIVKVTIENGKTALITKTSPSQGVTFPGLGVVQVLFTETDISSLCPDIYSVNVHAQLPSTSAEWELIDRLSLPVRKSFR